VHSQSTEFSGFTADEREAIAYALDYFATESEIGDRRAVMHRAPFTDDASSAPWCRLADRVREARS
jgi:hypothetical protein